MDFLIQTIFYFVLFNIIIIVFGYNILSMFFKKILITKPSNIKTFILSLIIGFTSYIILSYIFITIWNFNVFTAYYFYVFFDIAGLIYVIKRRRLSSSLRKENPPEISLKKRILDSIIKNKSIFILISVFVYIIIFYILKFWPQISSTTAQYAYDPYLWEGEVYYLLKYNSLDYVHTLYAYPAGFVLYVGGILGYKSSIGLEQVHFTAKLVPSLILIENMFLMTLLAYKLFPKRKIFIFLVGTSMYFFSFFLYRSLLFVPTILVTQLEILMLFLIYFKDLPAKFSNILFGLILGTMILTHPFYGLINCLFFFVYKIIYGIFSSKSNNSMNIYRKVIFKFKFIIKNNIFTFLVIIVIFFIYFFNLLIKYNYNWANNAYLNYFSLTLSNPINPIESLSILYVKNLAHISKYFFTTSSSLRFPNYGLFGALNLFVGNTSTIFLYFDFSIICLIWPLWKYYSRKYDTIVLSMQIFSSLAILFFLFRPIVFTDAFWNMYKFRLPEIVTPYIILITSIGILFLSIKISNLTKRIFSHMKQKISFINSLRRKKTKINKIEVYKVFSTIFLLIIFIFSINFQVQTKVVSSIYYFDDNFDQFLFTFRNVENVYYENNTQFRTIHYDQNDTRVNQLLKSFFSWDNYLNATTNFANNSQFVNYWNNNISIGQLLVLSIYDKTQFNYIKLNYENIAILMYSNSEILVIAKMHNISLNQ